LSLLSLADELLSVHTPAAPHSSSREKIAAAKHQLQFHWFARYGSFANASRSSPGSLNVFQEIARNILRPPTVRRICREKK